MIENKDPRVLILFEKVTLHDVGGATGRIELLGALGSVAGLQRAACV